MASFAEQDRLPDDNGIKIDKLPIKIADAREEIN